MAVSAVLSPRSATEEDRSRLANLLHFETHVHRHLDWRRPLDWLGHDPYLVLESGSRLLATLVCPPDPPGVSWIRLFAATSRLDPNEAWGALWQQAYPQLRSLAVHHAAAIPLQGWFRDILAASQFTHTHNVVVLDWNPEASAYPDGAGGTPGLRLMKEADISGVVEVDRRAFTPLWQNSKEAVTLAFKQAGLATVIEDEGRIAAFQISTWASRGLHLARLATHPDYQGCGLASSLVRHTQQQVLNRSDALLTVNTQDNNAPSLALYAKLGFKRTREQFPVFQFDIN